MNRRRDQEVELIFFNRVIFPQIYPHATPNPGVQKSCNSPLSSFHFSFVARTQSSSIA